MVTSLLAGINAAVNLSSGSPKKAQCHTDTDDDLWSLYHPWKHGAPPYNPVWTTMQVVPRTQSMCIWTQFQLGVKSQRFGDTQLTLIGGFISGICTRRPRILHQPMQLYNAGSKVPSHMLGLISESVTWPKACHACTLFSVYWYIGILLMFSGV